MTRRLFAILIAAIVAVSALAVTAAASRNDRDDGKRDRARALVALLTGANEVDAQGNPNQGDLDAAGFAAVEVDRSDGQVCVTRFAVGGATTPFGGFHIHQGAAGVNGPIVVDFTSLLPSGIGCVPVEDKDLLKQILKDPAGFYVNVHNADFPAGAVRGQLERLART